MECLPGLHFASCRGSNPRQVSQVENARWKLLLPLRSSSQCSLVCVGSKHPPDRKGDSEHCCFSVAAFGLRCLFSRLACFFILSLSKAALFTFSLRHPRPLLFTWKKLTKGRLPSLRLTGMVKMVFDLAALGLIWITVLAGLR